MEKLSLFHVIIVDSKRNQFSTLPLLFFFKSKAFAKDFVGFCNSYKGLRIDSMNHFLHFHNFISSDNTVDDFQIFFTIVALTKK